MVSHRCRDSKNHAGLAFKSGALLTEVEIKRQGALMTVGSLCVWGRGGARLHGLGGCLGLGTRTSDKL